MVTLPLNPLKIPSYLNLANAIKNLPKKNTWTFYDVEADVLYINFHQPALPADDSELTDDDIFNPLSKWWNYWTDYLKRQ